MKLHRFYVGQLHDKWGNLELKQHVWVNDVKLVNQWLKVLRYKLGEQLILFNDKTERLYRISKIEFPLSVGLELVTELERKAPKKDIYLLWSLLKKDKNEWVIQKATELGVRHFVPVIADRSEKTGFDSGRAKKIIIEAVEQCGRADIPVVREPVTVDEALAEYSNMALFVSEKADQEQLYDFKSVDSAGVIVGPEGGWSDREKALFLEKDLPHINIAPFTLRAETAAVVAVTKLM